MCIGSNDLIQPHKLHFFQRKPKRTKLRVLRLSRRNKQEIKGKFDNSMVLKNLKLYMKNISIQEENDKLRKQASLLHQENLALMSEFQKRFNKCDFGSTTLNIACLEKEH